MNRLAMIFASSSPKSGNYQCKFKSSDYQNQKIISPVKKTDTNQSSNQCRQLKSKSPRYYYLWLLWGQNNRHIQGSRQLPSGPVRLCYFTEFRGFQHNHNHYVSEALLHQPAIGLFYDVIFLRSFMTGANMSFRMLLPALKSVRNLSNLIFLIYFRS